MWGMAVELMLDSSCRCELDIKLARRRNYSAAELDLPSQVTRIVVLAFSIRGNYLSWS